MSLSVLDYQNYYSSRCKQCGDNKYIIKNDIRFVCPCQEYATIKFKFDEIKIYPQDIKQKTWNDFIGVSDDNSNLLDPNSFVKAKESAMTYCFGSALVNRSGQILRHLYDGKSVIIYGDSGSGKTLISILLLKEVLLASFIKKVTFEWVNANSILDAARWQSDSSGNSNKVIDIYYLDNLAECDFLFIDKFDIAPERADHRAPPDMMSLNILFNRRIINNKPTIINCTSKVAKYLENERYQDVIGEQWGTELYSILMNKSNVSIRLKCQSKTQKK